MLFAIFVALIVIGIIIDAIATKYYYDTPQIIGAVSCMLGLIATLISVLFLVFNHAGVDGYIAKCNARHEALVYQYENDIYDNDNDLGKRDLMEDIQAWNEDLAWNKENQDDFWIGIYIPNIYDQFEFIEFEKEDN